VGRVEQVVEFFKALAQEGKILSLAEFLEELRAKI
jgi:hypothetical protein